MESIRPEEKVLDNDLIQCDNCKATYTREGAPFTCTECGKVL